jgi:hypothetical protein
MYSARPLEAVGESSVSVVAGVRTVTTNKNERGTSPRCAALFAYMKPSILSPITNFRKAHVTSDCEGMRRQHILRMISPLICLAFVIT